MARCPRGWHPEDIKAALRKRFGPITHLSTSWGYNRTAIGASIKRPHFSISLERKIAEALDQPPHVLWPDRWSPDGAPLPRSKTQTNAIRAVSPTSSQKQ